MTSLQDLFSRDLRSLYRTIYSSTTSIGSNPVAVFLAFNTLHMHGEALTILKQLFNEGSKDLVSWMNESPLYSLLLPIAAQEYGVNLLHISSDSLLMFRTALDDLIDSGDENIAQCFEFFPSNYMLGQLRTLKPDKVSGKNIGLGDELTCLIDLVEGVYPDHFVSAKSYLETLLNSYRLHQSNAASGIPVDSTFFRTFGHSIFQPDWLSREFSLASQLSGTRMKPLFVEPHEMSLLGIRNSTLSNRFILDGWVETFRENPEHGMFMSIDELDQLFVNMNLKALFPFEFSLSKLITDNSLASFNETGSSVYEKTKSTLCLDLGSSIKRLGGLLDKPRLSDRKIAILHVRSSAFYGDQNHRNSDINRYSSLCEYLYDDGYDIYNYSNPDLNCSVMQTVYNYNNVKSKKLDALLVSSADLFITTPSGVGATGRLFGVSELITNFWPYLFDGVPSSLSVIPKLVLQISTGKILSLEQVVSVASSRGFGYFENSDKFRIQENTELDLLLGVQDFLNGRMIELNSLLKGSHALAPASFVRKYFS